MIILGISDSMTSGAAIIADGKVLAAVNEERLIRKKMAMGFPRNSIDSVLNIASLEIKDIDHVAIATESLFWRPEAVEYQDYFRKSKGSTRDLFLASGSIFAELTGGNPVSRKVYYRLKRILTKSRRKHIQEELRNCWGYSGKISFVDHHLAHCASANFTSGMDNATVISLDGAGDSCSSHVYSFTGGEYKLLNKIDSYDSIGNYYAYVTHLCGFQAHKHEGKITGLAAYGKNNYLDLFNRYVIYENGRIKNIGGGFDWSAINKINKEIGENFNKEDLSASIQTVLENVVSDYVEYWVQKSGISKVALSGGVFANVKLNQRIHELDSVSEIFVHPGMGDDGLAVGAALIEHNNRAGYKLQPVVKDVYLGGSFSETQIQEALTRQNFNPMKLADKLEREVAKLLAAGKVVARYDGRMEYGPRALGNRTIMYQPTDSSVNDWLNKRLVRTEFMPFAPVTLWEDRHNCYQNLNGAEQTARFMTITLNCTDKMKESCPAVCHVDGTARPQLIRKEDNPSYYDIIEEYKKITGLSSVINTSFNMHEEPIVHTPDDAIRAFTLGHLDYLIIGSSLIKNESQGNHPT